MNENESKNPDLRTQLDAAITRYGKKWFRFVKRLVGNSADAEDVLQEAVHRVLARNVAFPSEEQARLYLARAISNTAIAMYHTRKRERKTLVPVHENLISTPPAGASGVGEVKGEISYETGQLLQVVREGLSRLTVKQYEALRLTLLDPGESSIRDAGLVNGIPYSTLRHRTVQGLRRLRKYVHRALRTAPLKLVLA